MMENQQTLFIIKPDAIERGLIGELISRLERKGLRIVQMDMRTLNRATAEELYAPHRGKPFYEVLMEFMTARPIVAARVEGPGAIALVRNLMGATDPLEAQPGSIRGDFSNHVTWNLCHGSDEPANAKRELAILFPELDTSPEVSVWRESP